MEPYNFLVKHSTTQSNKKENFDRLSQKIESKQSTARKQWHLSGKKKVVEGDISAIFFGFI